jgi:hypothetical protein
MCGAARLQRAPSANRAGHDRLTIDRGSSRRRTARLLLADTCHFGKRSTYRNRRTHRQRSAHWDWRTNRSTHRQRSTHWNGRRNRDRCADGHRRSHWNRPRQGHRNTGHVGEWGTSRTARGRGRRCRSGLTRRRLETFVAAGYQGGGGNVWAQRHGDSAQPSPNSDHPDADSIKDRHRRRLLHSCSDIPSPTDAAEPHGIPKSRLDDCVNYREPTETTRRAAPRRFQMVTFGLV